MSLTSSNIFDEGFSNPTDPRYVLQVADEASLPDPVETEAPDGLLAVDRETLHLWRVENQVWVDKGELPGAGDPDEGGEATSIAWGNITGTLSNQSDVFAAIAAKANTSHTHVIADLSSGSATSGHVVTADGSGGATWAAPTGGGSNPSSEYVEVTASRDITSADLGKTLVYAGSSDITLTVDDGTSNGFVCTVLNVGTGDITFAVEGTDTLKPSGVKLLPGESGLSAASVYHHAGIVYVVAAEQNLESFLIAASGSGVDLTTGAGKVTFRMPYAFFVTGVRASVKTAPTGSSIIVDINEGGSTILSTRVSIDAGETTSVGSANPPVISDAALAYDAVITVDIDQVGSSTAGQELMVTLLGYRA